MQNHQGEINVASTRYVKTSVFILMTWQQLHVCIQTTINPSVSKSLIHALAYDVNFLMSRVSTHYEILT